MRRAMLVLASVVAADVLAYTLILPQLGHVAARFGLTPAGTAALFIAPVAAGALGALAFVPLSERHGRKPVLVGTCLVTAEALFVLAWAGDVYMLSTARVMAGLVAGNIAVAESSLRDIVETGDVPLRVTALACAAGSLGGWALGLLGPTLARPAYAGGALAVLSLVSVVSLLPETHPAHGTPAANARGGTAQ